MPSGASAAMRFASSNAEGCANWNVGAKSSSCAAFAIASAMDLRP
jgi:hypothetical protein